MPGSFPGMDGGTGGPSFLQTPANESNGNLSPDGRWLACQSDETGTYEIYVLSFPGKENGRSRRRAARVRSGAVTGKNSSISARIRR